MFPVNILPKFKMIYISLKLRSFVANMVKILNNIFLVIALTRKGKY